MKRDILCQRCLLLLVGLCVAATCATASPRQQPNILLLMAEDMSPRVQAFGDPVAVTPNLDRLAGQGVRYPNTFTAAGVCAPNRAATITGMHQISFGGQHMRTATRPEGSYKTVPPLEVKGFPELLRAAGYFTYTTNKLDYQFSSPFVGSGPFTIWDEEGSDVSWRDRPDGQPFFGYQNYGVTHESSIFPPLGNWPYSMMHFVMQVMKAWQGRNYPEVEPISPDAIEVPPYYPDTPTVRQDMARLYTNIRIMDAQIGQVLEQLEQDGLAEETIVIWTTDHGDGLPRAKRELFDAGIQVPMIIRWPEKYRPAGLQPGAIDQRLISFVDLAPTILALAGVEVPEYIQGRDINDSAQQARQYIYASRDRIDEVLDRQRAVRDGQFKYIRSWYPQQEGGHHLKFRDNMDMVRELYVMRDAGQLDAVQMQWFEAPGEERLFDVQADPYEINDLSENPAYSEVLERMRDAYRQWAARVDDWSEQPESEMVARFEPDGEQQQTPVPTIELINGNVTISSAIEGASLGYQIDDGAWLLYTRPFDVPPKARVAAKAVRYGWQESDAVSLETP